MIQIAKLIHADKHLFYETISENLSEFLYREKRDNNHFSLLAIYSIDANKFTLPLLQKKLRLTDKPIVLNNHLVVIAFNNTTEHSYVKAAENISSFIKEFNYQNNFFLSSVHSTEFPDNTLEMTNTLFDRLEYSIKNKLYDTIIYEDYII